MTRHFLLLPALLHLLFFVVEAFYWPILGARSGMSPEAIEQSTVLARNQGFYNLFLALGLSFAWFRQDFNLARYILIFMFLAGIVLVLTKPTLLTGALVQALPALFCLVLISRK